MAEVSALTPSPSVMTDQSVAPPSSSPSLAAESPKPITVPKSALYGDRAAIAAATAATTVKVTSVRLSHSEEATLALPEQLSPVTAASESACPPEEGKESFPTTSTQPNVSPGKAADPEAPQNPLTQPNLTSNSTSSSHTPPLSPPAVLPFSSDQLPDLKSDLPSLVVHGSSVPAGVPPSAPSGPALDTMSYLESVSMMSGTLESLSGIGEDGSSLGSDSELNGPVLRRTDKYGFLGGAQYNDGNASEISLEVSRHREMKWLDMFKNWDKWIARRFPKVKLRCRKGIPSSLRCRAWQLLSNSEELLMANAGKFEELERQPGDPKWLDIIEKDLHRQFPFHEMFAARGGHGQAFWCLVQICEKYLPGYYSAGLEAIQLDGEIFFSLLRRVCPMAYRHLKKFKIDPILYMTEWFVTALPVTEALIERECTIQVKKWRESRGALTHQPARRLHGTRDIHEQKRRAAAISSGGSLSFLGSSMSSPPPGPLRSSSSLLSLPGFRKSKNPFSYSKKSSFSGPFGPETQAFGGGTPTMIASSSGAVRPPVSTAAPLIGGGAGGHKPSPLATKPPTSPKSPVEISRPELKLESQSNPTSVLKPEPTSAPMESEPGPTSVLNPEPDPTSALNSEPTSVLKPKPTSVPKPEPKPTSLLKPEPEPTSASQEFGPVSESTLAPKSGPATVSVSGPETVPPSTSEPASGGKTSTQTARPSIPNQLQPPRVVSEQVTPTIPSPTANNMPLPPCEEEGKKKKRSKDEKKKEKEEEKQKAREKKADKEKAKKEKERSEKEKKREKGSKKKDKATSAEAEEKNGGAMAKKVA
ncbi:TBC1 domain family member 10B [Bagarius yarrelli]|uniref:TBC1 domain family member 10B n=1 Tax=Bagarius yarrelli TaxID=175774 RepID=A0A556UZI1_BAGYA|nr:TBC1 domain family member 10B [Bagarius yarrelli]